MFRLVLGLVVACTTGAAVAQDRPYRDFREHATPYAGPGRERDEPANVTEVLIGYFGPSDPDHPEGGDPWKAAGLAVAQANSSRAVTEESRSGWFPPGPTIPGKPESPGSPAWSTTIGSGPSSAGLTDHRPTWPSRWWPRPVCRWFAPSAATGPPMSRTSRGCSRSCRATTCKRPLSPRCWPTRPPGATRSSRPRIMTLASSLSS